MTYLVKPVEELPPMAPLTDMPSLAHQNMAKAIEEMKKRTSTLTLDQNIPETDSESSNQSDES